MVDASSASGSHDLILGLAAGYHAGDVRPFLRSLAATGFSGRVVLFVSPTTRGLAEMGELGAETIPFARPVECGHVPYNAWRFFLYREYLGGRARLGAPPGRVLLTDVRDVVFQRDPFSFAWPPGLCVFYEDRVTRLGACPHMTRWTLGHLGPQALERMGQSLVSCSGTLLGDREGVRSWLDRLCAMLLPFEPPEARGMAGYDQAVHNLLLHEGAPCDVTAFHNDSPVLTLGRLSAPPGLDASGDVLNEGGEPAHIVHQYDRHPALFARMRRRWG